ncbi:hypothetical protein ED312_22445 [Sinomicrobium pectinilyticum]|uniref:Uncharacterized protein n=1 Tax=Sinomicrobium pectinilyticum TaxID=1084421 RepID=A0A3N0D1W1_SINP1|nr:hypothetical protein ED312_22445 [Sinomicrobium pectinilyticum]
MIFFMTQTYTEFLNCIIYGYQSHKANVSQNYKIVQGYRLQVALMGIPNGTSSPDHPNNPYPFISQAPLSHGHIIELSHFHIIRHSAHDAFALTSFPPDNWIII